MRNSPAATARRRRRDGNRWSPYILFDGGGTFARTGTATFVDADGVVQTAATGVRRDGHYIDGTRTLLLEPQRTNLCIRSEEFDTWTNFGTTSVTSDATTAPDGTMTADLVTSTVSGSGRGRAITFTGDGEKCFTFYIKQGTTASTRGQFEVRDFTALAQRHTIRVTWTGNVPTLSTLDGAGTLYPVEALANGWYRVLFSATGVVAANNNVVRYYPDLLSTGNVFLWGAQAENAVVPSSYIKTEGTTITRNADSLYFPFTAVPQAMTVYVRGVNREAYIANGVTAKRILHIGSATVSDNPRISVYCDGVGAALALYDDGISGVRVSSATGVALLNAVAEHRAAISPTGTITTGVSINGATEEVGPTSLGSTLPSAFAAPRLYLTGGLSGTNTQHAYTHVVVAQGEQTMATMRQLAGVA